MLWPAAIIVFGGLGLLLRKKKPATLALPPGKTVEEINAELWAQPGADFVVEIYGVDKFRAPPPPSSDSVTASANCDTIVVGKGWWDLAGMHAERIIDSGVRAPATIADRIMHDMMPKCAASSTPATSAFRAEIIDRLKGYIPNVPAPERNANHVVSGNQHELKKIPATCGSIVYSPGLPDSDTCVQPSPGGSGIAAPPRGARVIPVRGGNIATLISGRRRKR